MKKILFCLLICLVSFTLTGCGDKEKTNESDVNDTNNNDVSDIDVDLYSDDTKLVFDFNNIYKIVYYYEGSSITGLEYYYNYEDVATAKYAISMIKSQYEELDTVESVKQNGKYIVIKFKEEEFNDTTVEEVKQTYSYLKQIYESN